MRNGSFRLITLGSATLAFLLTIPSGAQAETVVPITVFKSGKAVQSGVGALIAPETVLINYKLIEQGDSYQAQDPNSGAVFVGTKLQGSDDADFALITVKGITGTQFSVAKDALVPGRTIVLVAGPSTKKEGTVHSISQPDRKNDYPQVLHTAVVSEGEYGAPVLNNCGELAGVSQNEKRNLLDKRLAVWPDLNRASDLKVLTSFLDQAGISFKRSENVCLSVQERLTQAEEEKQAKEQALEEIAKEKEAIESERKRLEEERKELEEQAEQNKADLEAEVQRNEEALEAQRKLEEEKAAEEAKRQQVEEAAEAAAEESEKRENITLIVIAALGALLLIAIIVGFILARIRKRKQLNSEAAARIEQQKRQSIELELEQERVAFNNILLIGQNEDGSEYRVKLNGKAIARAEDGQILGRSAQHADYVINLEQISRQHVRFFVVEDLLMIEDLNSFNGSAVNDADLAPGEPKPVQHGDSVRIGTVLFTVHFMDND